MGQQKLDDQRCLKHSMAKMSDNAAILNLREELDDVKDQLNRTV